MQMGNTATKSQRIFFMGVAYHASAKTHMFSNTLRIHMCTTEVKHTQVNSIENL